MLFPNADLYTLVYAPDRVSNLIKSMKICVSRLNDVPNIERIYRYWSTSIPANY